MRINMIGMIIVLVALSTMFSDFAQVEPMSGTIDYWRGGVLAGCGLLVVVESFILMISTHRKKLEEKAAAGKEKIHAESLKTLESQLKDNRAQLTGLKNEIANQQQDFQEKLKSLKSKSDEDIAKFKRDVQDKDKTADAIRSALAIEKSKSDSLQRKLDELGTSSNANSGEEQVLKFLSLLQKKGRFLDFLMDEVAKRPDQQVGAVARVVHQGCSDVLKDFFEIKPVLEEAEGTQVEWNAEQTSKEIKVLGESLESTSGKLMHKGWLTQKVELPEVVDSQAYRVGNKRIIVPAEVQV